MPDKNEMERVFFDYNALDRSQRAQLKAAATAIKACIARTQNDIIEVGRRLSDVRDSLEHGEFLKWIDAEFGMSQRSAYNFIQVSETFGKFATVANLTFHQSALYALASPSVSDETRQVAVELAEEGEVITKSAARDLIEAAKPKPAPKAPAPKPTAPAPDAPAPYDDDLGTMSIPDDVVSPWEGISEDMASAAPVSEVAPPPEDAQATKEAATSTPAAPPEKTAAESLPLYESLSKYGHGGRIFRDQADLYYNHAETLKKVRALGAHVRYTSGPLTDAIRSLVAIPDPAEWEGCPHCKGSLRVGERADPCTCKGGFTTHKGEGVSADVVSSHASA